MSIYNKLRLLLSTSHTISVRFLPLSILMKCKIEIINVWVLTIL